MLALCCARVSEDLCLSLLGLLMHNCGPALECVCAVHRLALGQRGTCQWAGGRSQGDDSPRCGMPRVIAAPTLVDTCGALSHRGHCVPGPCVRAPSQPQLNALLREALEKVCTVSAADIDNKQKRKPFIDKAKKYLE